MIHATLSSYLWGQAARWRYLFIATILMLFAFLGAREIWTQEHRWADIVYAMFYHHDFLHPSLEGTDYYDKPLLSYWLIALFAKITGSLSTWVLRVPSALAGVLAIFAIYRLGWLLVSRRLGFIAGWLLLTAFYFVFWARTASADMLNLAGTLFAVMWYFEKKSQLNFVNYTLFFLIMAITALCKGLVGPVITVLAILPDLLVNKNWQKHLRWAFFLALIPAAILYILPFWASTYFSVHGYQENGLYLVYRENILRYFQPFDHKDPIYTYFLYLPIYTLPWAVFLLPAIFTVGRRWGKMAWHAKWMVWSTGIIFLFLTLSGSRRSYYVLPLVPFALLMTADWINQLSLKNKRWDQNLGRLVILFASILFLNFAIFQPLYYSQAAIPRFVAKIQALPQYNKNKVVLLDAESKLRFYLNLQPNLPNASLPGDRSQQTAASLIAAWPVLKNKPADGIFITRKIYRDALKKVFPHDQLIEVPENWTNTWLKRPTQDDPIAFMPK